MNSIGRYKLLAKSNYSTIKSTEKSINLVGARFLEYS